MRWFRPLVVALSAVLCMACSRSSTPAVLAMPGAAADQSGAAAASASARFDALLERQWQYHLEHNPEFASVLGDRRYNDRWSDYSLTAIAADRAANAAWLRQFEAIDPVTLDQQRRLSLRMMRQQLRDRIDGIDLKTYEMPLEPVGGIHVSLAGISDALPFENAKDYRDYIARLRALPVLIDQLIALSRQGASDGLVQPRYLLQRLPVQIEQIAAPAAAASPFAAPLKRLEQGALATRVGEAERAKLRAQLIAAVDAQVRPAYRKLAAFVREEYAAQGREHEGVWSLPDGDKRYAYAIRTQTTSGYDAEQIHQIGLREVARIEGEMTAIAHAQGYPDLASLRRAVAADRRHFARTGEQILELYRGYIAGMQPMLRQLFGDLPKTPLQVRAMPAYRRQAPGAEYWQGAADGSRPAIVMVNSNDAEQRSLINIETTAYHEGVPGHHLQISLAQTLPLPPFRQQAGYNAFIEGWALYAERLGKEAGFFKDPYSDYGRLCGELLRANRLVLDTGVHYKRWNRQQMVAFFRAHPSDDEPSLQAETDRYIVWPGQALGYKLGQLQIQALRLQAEQTLGSRFDIRAFHEAVLGGGAMPLELLRERIEAWIAQRQRQPGTPAVASDAARR